MSHIDTDINLSDVQRSLAALGIDAHIDHTGGGVYALYAGPKRKDEHGDDRWAALVGPAHAYDESDDLFMDPGDCYLGTDDEGDAPTITLRDHGVHRVVQIVELVREQVKYENGEVLSDFRASQIMSNVDALDEDGNALGNRFNRL